MDSVKQDFDANFEDALGLLQKLPDSETFRK
jgi:hypothetical protein